MKWSPERVKLDPQFFDRFDNLPMEQDEMPEWFAGEGRVMTSTPSREGKRSRGNSDARLAGRVSLLTDYSPQSPRVASPKRIARCWVSPRARAPDAEAIDRLLNPARNPYRTRAR